MKSFRFSSLFFFPFFSFLFPLSFFSFVLYFFFLFLFLLLGRIWSGLLAFLIYFTGSAYQFRLFYFFLLIFLPLSFISLPFFLTLKKLELPDCRQWLETRTGLRFNRRDAGMAGASYCDFGYCDSSTLRGLGSIGNLGCA